MVTDGLEPDVEEQTDEVSQDQATLDVEQGLEATPEFVSKADHDRAVQELAAQVRGLQGKQDKALNSIRQDASREVDERVEARLKQMVAEQQRSSYIAQLSDEQREVAEPLLNEIQALRTEMMPQTQPVQQQAVNGVDYEALDNAAKMVQRFGLAWDDEHVRYGVIGDPNLTPDQQEELFYQSILVAVQNKQNTAPSPAAAPQRQTANPPVEAEPSNARGTIRNADDLRDAFIQGKLSNEEYKQRMQSFGEAV